MTTIPRRARSPIPGRDGWWARRRSATRVARCCISLGHHQRATLRRRTGRWSIFLLSSPVKSMRPSSPRTACSPSPSTIVSEQPVKGVGIFRNLVLEILLVVAPGDRLAPFHRAGIRRQLADQYAQEGGFTDSVRADNADLLTARDVQVEFVEQRRLGWVELLAEVFRYQNALAGGLGLVEADIRACDIRALQFRWGKALHFLAARLQPARRAGLLPNRETNS